MVIKVARRDTSAPGTRVSVKYRSRGDLRQVVLMFRGTPIHASSLIYLSCTCACPYFYEYRGEPGCVTVSRGTTDAPQGRHIFELARVRSSAPLLRLLSTPNQSLVFVAFLALAQNCLPSTRRSRRASHQSQRSSSRHAGFTVRRVLFFRSYQPDGPIGDLTG
jgi:hypothetical protein